MIKLENVTKTIGKKLFWRTYLQKINQGDLVAIHLGKVVVASRPRSNLLGLIDGDYSGHYEIFGQKNVLSPISVKSPSDYPRTYPYLFQIFALIDNETVEYNLMLALRVCEIVQERQVKKIEEF